MKRVSRRLWVISSLLVALALALMMAWAGPASAGDVDGGKAIYKKNCAMCHGPEGAGDGAMGKMLKPPPPSFADAERMASRADEELITRIKEGKSPMPAYGSRLNDDQIQDVLAYIRSLSEK